MADIVSEIKNMLDRRGVFYETNVSGERLTSFGSGGEVALLAHPKSAEEILELSKIGEIPVLGGGSNVLLPSSGCGAIVKLDEWRSLSRERGMLTAQAGVKMPVLARAAAEMGLSGAEFASGIPGSVGGAIKTNASAFGQAISDGLVSVTALVCGRAERLFPRDLAFSYHRARLPENCVILSASFALAQGGKEKIRARMKEIAERRASTQPKGRSAGSVFRKDGEVPAAIYIEKTGLKGLKIGGARLSEKHCNFIVNEGGATTEDFFSLAEIVREKVKEKVGVSLEYEVEKW